VIKHLVPLLKYDGSVSKYHSEVITYGFAISISCFGVKIEYEIVVIS